MEYMDIITLIAESTTQDEDGYRVTEETESEVYADVKSVTRTEFYDAMRAGVSASIVFHISFHDYENQRIAEYNGTRYKVERTYRTDADHIELTCSEVMR